MRILLDLCDDAKWRARKCGWRRNLSLIHAGSPRFEIIYDVADRDVAPVLTRQSSRLATFGRSRESCPPFSPARKR